MAAKKKTPLIKDYKTLRVKMRLNQVEFWSRLGVTQSGRYAGGRYVPNGRCYVSQEAYEQAEALVLAWIKLKRDLQYGRIPEDVTIDDIELARLLLGMTSNAKLTGAGGFIAGVRVERRVMPLET